MLPRLFRITAVLLSLLAAAPALAHTRLERSSPAGGDTVRGELREVRIRFSQAVEPALTALTLLRDGVAIPGAIAEVEGSQDREYAFTVARPLLPGVYEARWRTAGADGHVLQGSFGFLVLGSGPQPPGTRATPAPPPTSAAAEGRSPAQRPHFVIVRWLWFAALLLAVGVAAFRYGVLARLDRDPLHGSLVDRAEQGTWYVAMAAAALSGLTLALRLWLQADALGGDAGSSPATSVLLTGTVWGLAWLVQALATLALVIGLAISRAPHGRAAGWMGAAAAGVLLCAVPALSGHAAAVEPRTGLAILSDALHVLGAGVWLGTLVLLLAVGIPAATAEPDSGAAVGALAHGFSPVALLGAGLAGATGLLNAVFQLTAVNDLWTTGYGRVLLLKLALLAAVGALGFYNWRRVLPQVADDGGAARLRRSAGAELAFGAVVLLVTAVLVALPLPSG